MITAFLLSIPGYILTAIISLLPLGGQVPSEWVSAIQLLWGYMNAFSFIIPVSTFLAVLTLALLYHVGIFGWHAFNWILKKIPGMN